MTDRIVKIEWVDACMETEWQGRKQATAHSITNCETVGYLLKKNRTEVTVFQSISHGSGQVSELLAIPRKCISKIIELREGK